MTLLELSGKELQKEEFIAIDSQKIIVEAMAIYGFKDNDEKKKVKFKLGNNFQFLGSETIFKYILFNLVKNSLYYLKEYPDSVITIGTETKTMDKTQYNVIFVHDTGPGIPINIIPKLFDDFYTSGKKEGTGLGLVFCKRNMKLFGGDIICESKVKEWTKFSLLFPALNQEDIKKHYHSNKQKILLVDDEKTNLLITRSKIEKNSEFICDIVENGSDAIDLVQEADYKLILMDVHMPVMSGIESARRIKEIKKDIPIIALTSLDHKELEKESRDEFNWYLKKPIEGHILHRTIFKLTMLEDSINYVGDEAQYLPNLRNKKILLADDQAINRKIMTKKLSSVGVIVEEASDGKEMVEKFTTNLRNNSKYDLILADINMTELNGDEASLQIREIEKSYHITYCNRVPIIAISGDGQAKDIKKFFAHQMTDYFVKGSPPENLIKLIAVYLSHGIIYKAASLEEKSGLQSEAQNGDVSTKYFNYDKLRFFNRKEQIEFMEKFISDSTNLFKKVIKSYNDKNLENLSLELHSLKGILGNIGASQVYDCIVEIEFIINNKTNENYAFLIKKAIVEFKKLRQELLVIAKNNKK